MDRGTFLDLEAFQARLSAARAELAARERQLLALGEAQTVTIYAYGAKGRELAPMLRSRGIRCLIFDNGQGSRERAAADGFEVTLEIDPRWPIIVAAGQNQIEILGSLAHKAFNLAEASYGLDLPAPFRSARTVAAAVVANAPALHAVYKSLDPASAAAFLDVLEFRASMDVHKLRNRRPVGEMWTPPFAGLKIRSFCDIGAYDGDTIRMMKATFPSLHRTFTIEPNPHFEGAITATAVDIGVVNSHFEGAAWRGGSRLTARTLVSGMFVIEESPVGEIKAEPLDALLAGETFDLIKMDVEGTEHQVIEGAHKSIAAAQCVSIAGYHLPCDLFELPAKLAGFLGGPLGKQNATGWQLAFAHYSQTFDDSIFYAWRLPPPTVEDRRVELVAHRSSPVGFPDGHDRS